jgi:hypothetical protein
MQRHRAAPALLAVTLLVGGCSDGGDDLRDEETDVGEDGTEVVPGEGGPVD